MKMSDITVGMRVGYRDSTMAKGSVTFDQMVYPDGLFPLPE